MAYRELWFCDPASDVRKCRSVPCHGHRVTRDQHLVARLLAWLQDVDWWALRQAEHRDWWRKAYATLQAMRADSDRDRVL